MLAPVANKIPSESTIECLTNHFIINEIGSPHAWIYLPSRREEKRLGYDASLRGTKAAVVQYKKIARVNKGGSYSISISSDQLKTLRTSFPRCQHPYVFYSFSTYESYHSLETDFSNHILPVFFKKTVFFNIDEIPANTSSLRFKAGRLTGNGNYHRSDIRYYDGPEWVKSLLGCQLGENAAIISEMLPREQIANLPRVSTLLMPYPNKTQLDRA